MGDSGIRSELNPSRSPLSFNSFNLFNQIGRQPNNGPKIEVSLRREAKALLFPLLRTAPGGGRYGAATSSAAEWRAGGAGDGGGARQRRLRQRTLPSAATAAAAATDLEHVDDRR